MRASGAAPISRAWATMAPATAVPCACAFSSESSASKLSTTMPELGMSEVDAGVDHRDQHLVALGELMRLPQAQLRQRVLSRVALAERRGGWRLALGRQLLLEPVDVVWLRGQNDAFGLQGADDRGHGAPVGNRPAGHGDVVGGEGCDAVEPQPTAERVDGLVGHA